jgi:hypothetical protein
MNDYQVVYLGAREGPERIGGRGGGTRTEPASGRKGRMLREGLRLGLVWGGG